MLEQRKQFLENGDGVHLMFGEFTLCGDSFDIFETEGADDVPEGPLVKTSKRTVSCEKCCAFIHHCRRVFTSR